MCELDQQSRAHMTLGVGKKIDFLFFLDDIGDFCLRLIHALLRTAVFEFTSLHVTIVYVVTTTSYLVK